MIIQQEISLEELSNCLTLIQGKPVPIPPLNLLRLVQLKEYYKANKINPYTLRKLVTKLIAIHDNYKAIERSVYFLQYLLQQIKMSALGGNNKIYPAHITQIVYGDQSKKDEIDQQSKQLIMGIRSKANSSQNRKSNLQLALFKYKKRKQEKMKKKVQYNVYLKCLQSLIRKYSVISKRQLKYIHFDNSISFMKKYDNIQFFISLWDSNFKNFDQSMAQLFIPLSLQQGQLKINQIYWGYLDYIPHFFDTRFLIKTEKQYYSLGQQKQGIRKMNLIDQIYQLHLIIFGRMLFFHLKRYVNKSSFFTMPFSDTIQLNFNQKITIYLKGGFKQCKLCRNILKNCRFQLSQKNLAQQISYLFTKPYLNKQLMKTDSKGYPLIYIKPKLLTQDQFLHQI